jgi:hypothetical protein
MTSDFVVCRDAGRYVSRSVGEIVIIDAEIWAHFGSAEAVNDALRRLVAENKKAAGSQTWTGS